MRALRFNKTGSLDELSLVEMPRPSIAPGEVLIEIKAATINPSDIKNVLGKMHETTVPRIPGRDFAGIVVEGDAEWLGKRVFGSGGGLGFTRDGTHAGYVAVPANGIVPLPANLSFAQAAAIGLPFITAWASMVDVAKVHPGDTVLILGPTGAVGGAAVHIVRTLGARIIATLRNAAENPAPSGLPVDYWIDLSKTSLPAGVREATGGRGADVIFDVVGGAMFEPCLASLAPRGRQVAISSSPDPIVSFNLVNFYHNQSLLLGFDSLKLTLGQGAAILHAAAPHFESGEFPPPKVETFPLTEAPRLYREINTGKQKSKPILEP